LNGVRDVALARKYRRSALAQQGLSLRQLIAVPGANGETAIEACKLERESEPQTTGTTSDENGLAANIGAVTQAMREKSCSEPQASGRGEFP